MELREEVLKIVSKQEMKGKREEETEMGIIKGRERETTQRVINRVNSYYVLMYRMKLSKTKD